MLRRLIAVRCQWVEAAISAAAAIQAENAQNKEISKQENRAAEEANRANVIEMEAYRRDRQMEERQQAFDANKEQYQRWENLINKAPKLKEGLINIWSRRAG
jgi:hypothetical protein